MRFIIRLAVLGATSMMIAASRPPPSAIDVASDSLGVTAIKTLQFTGSGATFLCARGDPP